MNYAKRKLLKINVEYSFQYTLRINIQYIDMLMQNQDD